MRNEKRNSSFAARLSKIQPVPITVIDQLAEHQGAHVLVRGFSTCARGRQIGSHVSRLVHAKSWAQMFQMGAWLHEQTVSSASRIRQASFACLASLLVNIYQSALDLSINHQREERERLCRVRENGRLEVRTKCRVSDMFALRRHRTLACTLLPTLTTFAKAFWKSDGIVGQICTQL